MLYIVQITKYITYLWENLKRTGWSFLEVTAILEYSRVHSNQAEY